ncbi:MAG: hypothetical protein IT299_00495 [Dehalococcoidia bacterium]|nr:hypothetical protein [Dehalococcoidia bacterium]
MAVKVMDKQTGTATTGKFAVLSGEIVALYSGITTSKNGVFRGCGRKQTFPAAAVQVEADDPAKELRSA